MKAKILPFPLARRGTLICRQAAYAASLTPDSSERHIAQQLKTQALTMRRKGIEEELITLELASMERAIRELMAPMVTGGAQ
jgi:hypothetical protein